MKILKPSLFAAYDRMVGSGQYTQFAGQLPSAWGIEMSTKPHDTFEHRVRFSGSGLEIAARLPLVPSNADTTERFVADMQALVDKSSWVTIDSERLTEVARMFTDEPSLRDRQKYMSAEAFQASPPDLNRAMFELALIVANQSGFITGEPGEKAAKWEMNGSGSAAMVQLVREMRESNVLPGIDFTQPEQVSEKLAHRLKGVPFHDERIAIFQELTEPRSYQVFGQILDQAQTDTTTYRFTFDHVKALAEALPKSFGEDPFYKKAILILIAMAGFGRHKGMDVQLDIPVASDYRLPQTLEGLGILSFNPALNESLEQGTSLHEDHPAVQHLRAASVVAAAELVKQTGFDSAAIDELLWSATKTAAKADVTLRPHMMVPTMRF